MYRLPPLWRLWLPPRSGVPQLSQRARRREPALQEARHAVRLGLRPNPRRRTVEPDVVEDAQDVRADQVGVEHRELLEREQDRGGLARAERADAVVWGGEVALEVFEDHLKLAADGVEVDEGKVGARREAERHLACEVKGTDFVGFLRCARELREALYHWGICS